MAKAKRRKRKVAARRPPSGSAPPAATARTDVDAPTLARVLRCDVRTVLKLAEDGHVVRVTRGRFALFESVGNVVEHYRARAAGRESTDGRVDAVTANAGFKDSQRRLTDLRIQQMEGTLISLPELEEVWTQLVQNVRQLFLAFPGRARFDLPHLSGHDQEVLTRLANDMLHEAAIQGAAKLPDVKVPDAAPAETDAA